MERHRFPTITPRTRALSCVMATPTPTRPKPRVQALQPCPRKRAPRKEADGASTSQCEWQEFEGSGRYALSKQENCNCSPCAGNVRIPEAIQNLVGAFVGRAAASVRHHLSTGPSFFRRHRDVPDHSPKV